MQIVLFHYAVNHVEIITFLNKWCQLCFFKTIGKTVKIIPFVKLHNLFLITLIVTRAFLSLTKSKDFSTSPYLTESRKALIKNRPL